MSTLSMKLQDAIRVFVMGHHLSAGLENEEKVCSIAAINLVLTGELTDSIPGCMSVVIGKWIVVIQDAISDELRNDNAWKSLLPLAAGTGREPAAEQRRLDMILDWMWIRTLPTVLPAAEKCGFGDEWRAMLAQRTPAATEAMVKAMAATGAVAGAQTVQTVRAVTRAATAARAVARADAARADAAWGHAAWAVAWAVAEAAAWAGSEATAATWEKFAPADLLRQLIEC